MNSKTILIFSILLVTTLFTNGCWEEQASPQITGKIDFPIQPEIQPPATRYIPPTFEKPPAQPLKNITIIVDPGHGGKDPGALARWGTMNEKDIVLDVSLKLAKELKDRGANVIMTRETDNFIELNDRAYFADIHNANLFISIHADAHKDNSVSGATFYIARSPLRKSRHIAESLETSFDSKYISNKGIRNADYRVLTKHSRPAVLVECGYITNKQDAYRLSTKWYRRKLVNALADGIEKAFE